MKQILLAALFLTGIQMARGADPAPDSAHYKAAEQILTLMDTPNVLKQSIDQMVKLQVQQNPTIAPYEKVMRDFLGKYMSWDSMKADLIKLYMGEFTEAELGELNKFYQTPVGRKTVEKLPVLMSKGSEIGTKRVQEHMAELQTAIEAEAKKQPPAASAAPKKK